MLHSCSLEHFVFKRDTLEGIDLSAQGSSSRRIEADADMPGTRASARIWVSGRLLQVVRGPLGAERMPKPPTVKSN